MLFDSVYFSLLHKDTLPLSPKSTLQWVGSNQDGTIVTLDSSMILRQLCVNTYLWTVLADLKDPKINEQHGILSLLEDIFSEESLGAVCS